MNEYEVTLTEADRNEHKIIVEAESAIRARDQAEDESGEEVLQVRFLRALTFSCRVRGAS